MSKEKRNEPEERQMKFAILTATNMNKYHPFDTVKKHMVSKLKEDDKLGDVAEAIEKKEHLDMDAKEPTRTLSTINVEGQDKDGNKIVDPVKEYERREEQRGLDIKYGKEYDAWQQRDLRYKQGKIVAYAIIQNDYTTKGMRDKVEEHPEYESKIKDDPVELMEVMNAIYLRVETRTLIRIWDCALH